MIAKAGVVVRETSSYEGKQGPKYAGGVSAESAGSRHLWMGRVELAVDRADRRCVAIIARTDPNEQESVVLLPDLEPLVPA